MGRASERVRAGLEARVNWRPPYHRRSRAAPGPSGEAGSATNRGRAALSVGNLADLRGAEMRWTAERGRNRAGVGPCLHERPGGRTPHDDRAPGRPPRFVAGRHDTTGGDGGIEVDLSGPPIGRLATRDPDKGLQFFQLETGDAAGRAAVDLRISLEGPRCIASILLRPVPGSVTRSLVGTGGRAPPGDYSRWTGGP